jgi:hypothetical protein
MKPQSKSCRIHWPTGLKKVVPEINDGGREKEFLALSANLVYWAWARCILQKNNFTSSKARHNFWSVAQYEKISVACLSEDRDHNKDSVASDFTRIPCWMTKQENEGADEGITLEHLNQCWCWLFLLPGSLCLRTICKELPSPAPGLQRVTDGTAGDGNILPS